MADGKPSRWHDLLYINMSEFFIYPTHVCTHIKNRNLFPASYDLSCISQIQLCL